MTQTDAVLATLRQRGPRGLTPMEALRDIGTFRLAARISEAKDLIRDDEEIVTERLTVNGKTVARYVLRRRIVEGAQQATIWSDSRP